MKIQQVDYVNKKEDGTPFVYSVKYWSEVPWNPFSIYIAYCKDFKDFGTFYQKFLDQHTEWDDFTFIDPRTRLDTLSRTLYNHIRHDWSITSIEDDIRLWNPSKSKFEKRSIYCNFK